MIDTHMSRARVTLQASDVRGGPSMFTLQVVRRPGEAAEQYAFLAEGQEDSRAGLASAFRAMLGAEGSIVAYNASFEWIETDTIRTNGKSLVSR